MNNNPGCHVMGLHWLTGHLRWHAVAPPLLPQNSQMRLWRLTGTWPPAYLTKTRRCAAANSVQYIGHVSDCSIGLGKQPAVQHEGNGRGRNGVSRMPWAPILHQLHKMYRY